MLGLIFCSQKRYYGEEIQNGMDKLGDGKIACGKMKTNIKLFLLMR
jgi:hypothetical protein